MTRDQLRQSDGIKRLETYFNTWMHSAGPMRKEFGDRVKELEDHRDAVHSFHARITDGLRGRLDDIHSLNKQLDDVRAVDTEQDQGAAVLSDRLTSLTRAVEGFAMKLEGMSSYTGYEEFSTNLDRACEEPGVEELCAAQTNYTDEEVLSMRRFELHEYYNTGGGQVVGGGRQYPDGHCVFTWFDGPITETHPDLASVQRRILQLHSVVLEFLDS